MSRSVWKSFLFNSYILDLYLNKKYDKKIQFKVIHKNSIILPLFINFNCKVYNGKTYINLKIVKDMVGYKFGDFILTRKRVVHKTKK